MGWIGAGAVRFRTVPLAAAASVAVRRNKDGSVQGGDTDSCPMKMGWIILSTTQRLQERGLRN